ncbi:MAG: hypothetical protein MJ001_02045 [Paludibacteraceae bacterium]|nr:hypothetical protein [Paludibacteraceae bacterium]
MENMITVIQWLGTLSFAFVAVGFVESFTSAICKVIFHSDENIQNEYKQCESILPDSESLKALKPVEIDGKSSNDKIQELQLRHNNIRRDIKEAIDRKIKELPRACQIRSLSAMSLYVVVICTILMFMCGIVGVCEGFVHSFVVSLSFISIVYFVVGWCNVDGNNGNGWRKTINFPSFMHSIICSLIVFVISFVCGFIFCFDRNTCIIFLAIFVSFGFLNFIVLAIIIGRKAKKYHKDIQKDVKTIKTRCEEISSDFNTLFSACKLSETLKAYYPSHERTTSEGRQDNRKVENNE